MIFLEKKADTINNILRVDILSDKKNKTKKLKNGSEVDKNEPHVWGEDQLFAGSHHLGDASLVERVDSKPVRKGEEPHLNVSLAVHNKKSKRKKEEKKKLGKHHQIDL